MNEKELRLECLKLAEKSLGEDGMGERSKENILSWASSYYSFINNNNYENNN